MRRTDAAVIQAIKDLIKPPDGSRGLRRTKTIMREVEKLGLGEPSAAVVRKVFFALGIEAARGPEPSGDDEPKVNPPSTRRRAPRGKDREKRQGRNDKGKRRVDVSPELAARIYAEENSLRKTAERLGISRQTVYKLAKDAKPPAKPTDGN